jgi:hypothetical protein
MKATTRCTVLTATPFVQRNRITRIAAHLTVFGTAACLAPDVTPQPGADAGAVSASAPAAAASDTQAREDWRRHIKKAHPLKKGCFHAAYPSTELEEVPCAPPPKNLLLLPGRAPTESIGYGIDYTAEASGAVISDAVGSFPSVTGVTNEVAPNCGNQGPNQNSFSVQLNSNYFDSGYCAWAADPSSCQAVQQFGYSNSAGLFIQYWLANFGAGFNGEGCSAIGWNTGANGYCVFTSSAVSIPTQSIASLAGVSMYATAESGETYVGLVVGDEYYFNSGSEDFLGLEYGWTTAEFNVFGDGCGTTAYFNSGSTIEVQLDVFDGLASTPQCNKGGGTTAELNNLDLVSCSASPSQINFTEGLPYNGGIFYGQNMGFQWTPTSPADWMYGSYKGECEPGQHLMGISTNVDPIVTGLYELGTPAHAMYCGTRNSADYPQTESCYGRVFGVPIGGDSRGSTAVSLDDGQWGNGDWDPGYYKGECYANEFVAGVSQSQTGQEDGLLCCPGNVTHNGCVVQIFEGQNSPGFVDPDWDFGFYKGECVTGQYVAGISSTTGGSPHAILCCNP